MYYTMSSQPPKSAALAVGAKILENERAAEALAVDEAKEKAAKEAEAGRRA